MSTSARLGLSAARALTGALCLTLALVTQHASAQYLGQNATRVYYQTELEHCPGVLDMQPGDLWTLTFADALKDAYVTRDGLVSRKVENNMLIMGVTAGAGASPLLVLTQDGAAISFSITVTSGPGARRKNVVIRPGLPPGGSKCAGVTAAAPGSAPGSAPRVNVLPAPTTTANVRVPAPVSAERVTTAAYAPPLTVAATAPKPAPGVTLQGVPTSNVRPAAPAPAPARTPVQTAPKPPAVATPAPRPAPAAPASTQASSRPVTSGLSAAPSPAQQAVTTPKAPVLAPAPAVTPPAAPASATSARVPAAPAAASGTPVQASQKPQATPAAQTTPTAPPSAPQKATQVAPSGTAATPRASTGPAPQPVQGSQAPASAVPAAGARTATLRAPQEIQVEVRRTARILTFTFRSSLDADVILSPAALSVGNARGLGAQDFILKAGATVERAIGLSADPAGDLKWMGVILGSGEEVLITGSLP